MEPKNRILLKVNHDDALVADRAVSDLMGNQVEKRKDFIQTHAKTSASWTFNGFSLNQIENVKGSLWQTIKI